LIATHWLPDFQQRADFREEREHMILAVHVADLLRYLRDILFGIAHVADEVRAELFWPVDFRDLFERAPVLAFICSSC